MSIKNILFKINLSELFMATFEQGAVGAWSDGIESVWRKRVSKVVSGFSEFP